MNLQTMGIMGVMALIASSWSQVKNALLRFRGIFIVKLNVTINCRDTVNGYLRRHYKESAFGDIKLSTNTVFLKPKNRYWRVGYEVNAQFNTYWDGWKPIFVNYDKDGHGVDISFIRGTFNARELFTNAIEEGNEIRSSIEDKEQSRYYIEHVYGSYGDSVKDESVDSQPIEETAESIANTKYLKWKPEDLGQVKVRKPFDNLYYGDETKDFMKELDNWYNSKDWFLKRGVPWRMGALLKGKPGTGKSSFVKAIAQKYDLPVIIMDLPSMSNEELQTNWKNALNRTPCVVLFEDLDRVFSEGVTVIKHSMSGKGDLTLDALLNCISGVENSDGILTIVTANYADKLDSALTRAGRLDKELELGCLTEEGKKKMAVKIIGGGEFLTKEEEAEIEGVLKGSGKSVTGAEFQKLCIKKALEIFWKNKS